MLTTARAVDLFPATSSWALDFAARTLAKLDFHITGALSISVLFLGGDELGLLFVVYIATNSG